MNSRFYPSFQKEQKTGMEKVHKLLPSKDKENNKINVRESMPSNWIYNEKITNQVFDEVTNQQNTIDRSIGNENNPFKKIDESAHKIRSTILNFEMQDQEYLLKLMDIQGSESSVDHLTQEDFLIESKIRLGTMIEEHLNFSERQVKLLDSLLTWFSVSKEKRRNENNNDLTNDPEAQALDIQKLKEMIDLLKNSQLEQGEKASVLHHDIVETLNFKMNEYQKAVSQKDLALSQLSTEINENKKKGRRSIRGQGSKEIVWENELNQSQRKILELQQQIIKLKNALNDFASKSKPLEEAQNILTTLNDQDFNKPYNKTISLEKELEIESMLKSLNDQVKDLKSDNKIQKEQVTKMRQNELVLEKKIALLDRQKKSLEATLINQQKKQEVIEQNYLTQIENINKLKNLITSNNLNSQDSTIEIVNKYETTIQNLKDQFRQQIISLQEQNDLKLKEQIQELSLSIQNGDHAKLFEQTINHYVEENEKLKNECKNQIKDIKNSSTSQVITISKQYEKILNKKQSEIEIIKVNIDNEVKNKIIEVQIDSDEQIKKKILEIKEQSINDLSTLRSNLTAEIEELKLKVKTIKRERDTLKSIIEASDIASTIFNEEEEENEKNTDNYSNDVIFMSLQELKEKEIEQKITQKFNIILKNQKESFINSKNWEINQAKNYYQMLFESNLEKIRSKLVVKIHELYEENPTDQIILEKLLSESLFLIDNENINKFEDRINQPTIPLIEVENKISEMREKIVELTSENEILKNTFKTFNKLDKTQGSAIFNALKEATEIETTKFAQIAEQNNNLQRELKKNSPLKNINKLNWKFVNPSSFSILPKLEKLKFNSNNSIPSQRFSNKNSSREKKIQNLENQICCSHCSHPFNYSNSDVKHKVLLTSILSCPYCTHNVLF